MMFVPKMNLRFFDEGDFDLEQFKQEFEKEYEEEAPPAEGEGEGESEEETESSEQETETETEGSAEGDGNSESSSENGEQEESKDGRAFAQMRHQLKEKEQYEAFVGQLAEQYGVKPDELMQRYEEQKLQQEAKQKGTDPEVLKRIKSLETENKQVKQQAASDKFNQEVSQTLKEYDVKDDDPTVKQTFEYIAQHHLDANNTPTIGFGDAYFLANKDGIIAKQVEAARQQQLEDKKKRQESSAVPSGGSGEAPESNEWTDDKVEKYLKDRGLLD